MLATHMTMVLLITDNVLILFDAALVCRFKIVRALPRVDDMVSTATDPKSIGFVIITSVRNFLLYVICNDSSGFMF